MCLKEICVPHSKASEEKAGLEVMQFTWQRNEAFECFYSVFVAAMLNCFSFLVCKAWCLDES